jgi:hypothetical protein
MVVVEDINKNVHPHFVRAVNISLRPIISLAEKGEVKGKAGRQKERQTYAHRKKKINAGRGWRGSRN